MPTPPNTTKAPDLVDKDADVSVIVVVAPINAFPTLANPP